jgi:hypothetical protein
MYLKEKEAKKLLKKLFFDGLSKPHIRAGFGAESRSEAGSGPVI